MSAPDAPDTAGTEGTDALAADGVTAQLPTSRPEVPSWRLILTLGVAAVASALGLSVVNELTAPAMASRLGYWPRAFNLACQHVRR